LGKKPIFIAFFDLLSQAGRINRKKMKNIEKITKNIEKKTKN
jgi:hypothetical protein